MILIDSSGLIASYDRADPEHDHIVDYLDAERQRLLSPFVLAEVDYLIPRFGGQRMELLLLDDVARGAYRLEPMLAGDIEIAHGIIEQYADLHLGLTDASIMVLAQRHSCTDVLTFDERHFRAVLGPGGKPFRILPADL